FMSIGRPKIVTKLQAVQTVLLFSLIYPLTANWDIFGASLAVFLSALAMFFVRNHILIKAINCKILELYKPIFIPMVLTLISIFSIISLKMFVIEPVDIYFFFSFIGVFILFFGFLSYIADRFLNYKIKAVIKEIRQSL
ncbi:hypothetical protein C5S29_02445, partial [ANME-1 cluster archaeon GoMg3.2]|nr:hypothetical protein [ANME-1 cluster archaeon GoMg3.2]